MRFPLRNGLRHRLVGAEIEIDEDPLGVGQGANELPDGRRQFPDERGHGHDLVILGALRVFQQIDDLDLIAASEMLFAEFLQIAQSSERLRRVAGDVQPQDVSVVRVTLFRHAL